MKKGTFFLMALASLSLQGACPAQALAQGGNEQFSAAFLKEIKPTMNDLQKIVPEDNFGILRPFPDRRNRKTSFLSYDRCSTCIDGVALAYAAYEIHKRYRIMDNSSQIASTSFLSHWYPKIFRDAGRHGNFCIDATGIVMQALVYKTIAKLLLLCACGDMADVLEYICMRTKKVVRMLV